VAGGPCGPASPGTRPGASQSQLTALGGVLARGRPVLRPGLSALLAAVLPLTVCGAGGSYYGSRTRSGLGPDFGVCATNVIDAASLMPPVIARESSGTVIWMHGKGFSVRTTYDGDDAHVRGPRMADSE
jgi:hypothetical protein